MNELHTNDDKQLSTREAAFIKAVFDAHQVKHGQQPSLIDGLYRATELLRCSSAIQHDLVLVLLAIECLPLPALAELTARVLRRVLPFAAPATRAIEAGIEAAESYAGIPRPSRTFRHLDNQPQDFFLAVHELPLSDKNVGKDAMLCFRVAYALGAILSEQQGAVLEGRETFQKAMIESVTDEPDGLDVLRATAVDARLLLDIDFFRGLAKVDCPPIFPLKTPLWPEGEPQWYRLEIAKMSTEAQPTPVPTPKNQTAAEASRQDSDLVRIPPLAFLRSMVTIFWSALRHPFQITEVDLSTGKVVRRY